MRLALGLHALSLLAALVQATAIAAEDNAPVVAPTPAPAPKKRLFGICILGLKILGDCDTPNAATTTIPIPSVVPSGFDNSGFVTEEPVPSTTTLPASATGSPGVSGASPSPTVSPTASPSASPSGGGGGGGGGGPPAGPGDPAQFSYPQPPLPARTYSAPASAFTADSYVSIFSQTRRFTLNIDYASGAPDGFQRSMMVINNQYPGPVIEANQGDTVEITVNNRLQIPTSMHWHGIHQNNTVYEDGIPGVTQCPISPGGSYTYKFKLDSNFGTYWYHSHYANTMADGIFGAFIVHSRNDPLKQYVDFDEERILYLGDHMRDQSMVIVDALHNETYNGYRGAPIPPGPDAILINGVGQTNCSAAQKGVKCSQTKPPRIKAMWGQKVRFRTINHGSHALIRFSIDKHVLTVIEADDEPIKPVQMHELIIGPGQRYSFVVTMNQGNLGDSFWMRASAATACMNPPVKIVQKAILQSTSFLGLTWFGKDTPSDLPWPDLLDPLNEECYDLDHYHQLIPRHNEALPKTTFGQYTFSSNFGAFVNAQGDNYLGFTYNGVGFTNYVNNPLLAQIENGLTLDPSHIAAITLDQLGAADIIINQQDILSHPFHLHGRPFHIVARGEGQISTGDIPSLNLNLVNPLRRDTLTIGPRSWVVIRLITDTPGVWAIHCHIGWHLAQGKLGAVIVRPDKIRNFDKPAKWLALCNGKDPGEIAPGRRAIMPPQARARHSPDDLEERDVVEAAA